MRSLLMKKIKWEMIKEGILDWLYPRHIKCIFCNEELDENSHNDTCVDCLSKLPFIKSPCPRCGGERNENNDGVCLNCKTNNFDFSIARSVFVYTDDIVKVIHKYKYNYLKCLSEPLSGFMSDYFATSDLSADFITAVPLHENRLKERGFNQSELLARALGTKFNIKYLDLCVKIVDNSRQASLGFAERKANVKGAYKIKGEYKKTIKDKTIMIVDDVYTTGATTSEIARVIKDAGARDVVVFTLAHGQGDGQSEEVENKKDK